MCVDFAPVIDVQWLNAPLPVRTSVGDVESSVDVLHVVDVCLRYKDTATYHDNFFSGNPFNQLIHVHGWPSLCCLYVHSSVLSFNATLNAFIAKVHEFIMITKDNCTNL